MPVLSMRVNDASRIIIDNSTVLLQIVTSLSDDSRSIIYNHKMFIVQAIAGPNVMKFFTAVIYEYL